MNEVNNVIKVFRNPGAIDFVIKTKGDDDLWIWQVSSQDWVDYWLKKGTDIQKYNAPHFSKKMCIQFVNDGDNDTLGCSWGSYKNLDELIKENDYE